MAQNVLKRALVYRDEETKNRIEEFLQMHCKKNRISPSKYIEDLILKDIEKQEKERD